MDFENMTKEELTNQLFKELSSYHFDFYFEINNLYDYCKEVIYTSKKEDIIKILNEFYKLNKKISNFFDNFRDVKELSTTKGFKVKEDTMSMYKTEIETTTNYMYGDETFTMSSSESKWINRIKKYSEQYPNDVKITYINEDGSIMAEINKKWFKISPPRKVSDKQRELASQRFKALRNKQKNKGNTNELE